MRRRTFLLGSSATLGIVGCAAPHAAPAAPAPGTNPPPVDPGTGPLSAVVEYHGQTYRYDEATGTDLGDYHDPLKRFAQGCIRATHDQLPLTIFFRPDRDSHRADVVFELGSIWSTTPPVNLDAYRVTIMRGDRQVFATDVPQHFWHSRWRWQSAPRPVTASVTSLITAGLIPHYDGSVCPFTPPSKAFTYSPMTLAGLAPNGWMTGERNDIGLVTEWQADYICTGRNLSTVLAQGEAMNTFPICFRDEHTGAPLDALKYANASMYPEAGGSPFIGPAPGIKMQLDPAHEPEGAYLPFLLTGDPYYLETMQFQDVFNLVTLPPHARYRTSGGVRAFAWSLRSAGRIATVTPASLPAWLLPQSYFLRNLSNYLAWLQLSVANTADPATSVFSIIKQASTLACDFWQSDFVTAALADAVRLGQRSAMPGLTWAIRQTIARTNGRSGWRRSHPTPYNTFIRPSESSPVPATWADLWAFNESTQPANLQPMPGDATGNDILAIRKGGDITYPSYTRGVLAMATRLDIADAKPCFEWMDQQIRQIQNVHIRMDYKWAIT